MEQLTQLITKVMGSAPVRMTRMTTGEMNEVYDILLPDGREIILRANETAAPLKGTRSNIEILSNLGLPVPTVIHSDVSKADYPFAYIILEKIPGRDLKDELPQMTRQQISELARTIVDMQKKVMTLPSGAGYGFAAIHKKANSKSWRELVEWDLACGLPYIQDIVGNEGIQRIKEKESGYRSYFEQVRADCFLDDITIKNVIMLNGKLQGIIDLDWVCYGDFLTMPGLTQASILADVGHEALIYLDELCHHWSITQEQRELIDFYSLIHAANLLRIRRNRHEIGAARRLERAIQSWIEHF